MTKCNQFKKWGRAERGIQNRLNHVGFRFEYNIIYCVDVS